MHLLIFFALHVLSIPISLGSVEETPSQARYLFNSNDHLDDQRRLTAAYAAAATVGPDSTPIPKINLGTADTLRAHYMEPPPIDVAELTSDPSDPLYMDEFAVYPVTRKDIGGYGDIHYHVMFPQDLEKNLVTGIVVECYPWVQPDEATKSTLSRNLSEPSSGVDWVRQGYIYYELFTQPLHIIREKEQIVTTVRDVAHFTHHLKTRTPDVSGKYVYFPKNLDISKLKIFFYGASAGGYLSMLVATYPERMRSHDGKYTFRASEYIDGFIANAPWGHPEWDANVLTGLGQERQQLKKVGAIYAPPEDAWFFDTQPDPDTYRQILPMNNLIHLDTPILLIHNLIDDNVLVQRSLDFISEALKDKITAQHGHLLVHTLLYNGHRWRPKDHNYLNYGCQRKVYEGAMHKFLFDINTGHSIGSVHLGIRSQQHMTALRKIKEISHSFYRTFHPQRYVRYPLNECINVALWWSGYIPPPDWALDNVLPCKNTLAFFAELKRRDLPMRGLERKPFDDKMMAFDAYFESTAGPNALDYVKSLRQDDAKVQEFKRIYEDLKVRYEEHNIERKDIQSYYFIA